MKIKNYTSPKFKIDDENKKHNNINMDSAYIKDNTP